MDNWHSIRLECTKQDSEVIKYLFQRFPSLRGILSNQILKLNSYLICHLFKEVIPNGSDAFALNLQALQGKLIKEPQSRLYLEQEFNQQHFKNKLQQWIFQPQETLKRINNGNISSLVNQDALNQLTYMLDQSNLVFVCGPLGCGKTTLIKQYIELYNLKELTLHMDETIDFQSLIGQFVCTQQIGVFTHKAGPLLYCDKIGAILVLKNYSESNEDFKQQLKRAMNLQKVEVNGQDYFIKKVKVIALQKDINKEEQQQQYIIHLNQPNLDNIDFKYFNEIKHYIQNNPIRDIIRLQKRFNYHLKDYEQQQYLPESIRTKLYLECLEILGLDLLDIFQLQQIKYITILQKYDHYLEFSKLGQIEIKNSNTQDNIVYNQYSSHILEQIMTCIINDEACLLIGDTGCGKTTLTQHCAKLFNKKLHIFNLSEGSDGQDLIGGFRPLNQDTLIKINFTKFMKYFTQIIDTNKNISFINKLHKLYENKKYDILLKCIQETSQQCQIKANDKLKLKFEKLINNLKISVQEMSFYFLTGNLIKAMRKGEWVLIDEINLANNELLQKILPAIEKTQLLFYERGDEIPIKIHPDFRIFGCMNPGTDIGKKELPINIKNKFTSIILSELTDKNDIIEFIKGFIGLSYDSNKLADLYLNLKEICKQHHFNQSLQTFSLRNLSRALQYYNKNKQTQLAMFNGLSLAFGSSLSKESLESFNAELQQIGLKSIQFIPQLQQQNYKINNNYVEFYGFHLPRGNQQPIPPEQCEYLITQSNFPYLLSCLRCISGTGIPILLEGPTSGGKTSLVYFLAKICGQKCHRINNHQNTQLEEYLGTYGQVENSIQFQEGLLVTAMRKGEWIILDELNLARSEILENLNRLLDDNQELFLPETQTILKPHSGFRIFGTQNPISYSGRKQLSKAFRNRFIEIQVEEISSQDLTNILKKRCPYLPETHIPLLRQTQLNINVLRSSEQLFMAMVTLRDLIKWGNRMKNAQSGKEHTAMEGYCLIVERVREIPLRLQLQQIIEQTFKIKLKIEEYYQNVVNSTNIMDPKYGIQWNTSFLRMAALTLKAQQNKEPTLLVGPPGIGKTTLCTMLAQVLQIQTQHIVCHQYLEISDFVGALRPVRDGGQGPFSFQEGPLLKCLKEGGVFLIDEVNMCPESVLEGLNSCLEQPATLTVNDQFYEASNTLVIVAAMNPSGDWGKKELTPALRSRFTEIFVFNPLHNHLELPQIVKQFEEIHCNQICNVLQQNPDMTFRDLLQIVEHIKKIRQNGYNNEQEILEESIDFVLDRVTKIRNDVYNFIEEELDILIPINNYYKINRAIILHNKPIMIQGPPQCGKTHIIKYLAKKNNKKCITIQFDEQSDLQELLGTDQPNSSLEQISQYVEIQITQQQGQFRFVPGPLLEGLRNGYWIILKNLNLAPQNVLEGLNSILDHRREIFIPELGQTIIVHQECRLFAIQNPIGEGRKGLPMSFLNRFIRMEFNNYEPDFRKLLCPNENLKLGSVKIYNSIDNIQLKEKILNISNQQQKITNFHNDSTLWAQQRLHFSDIIEVIPYCRVIQLYGQSGIGKKYLVQNIAKYMQKNITQIQLSKHTDSMELLGQYIQGDQNTLFKWQFSRLVEAAIKGEWVLLDNPSKELMPKLNQFIEEEYFTVFGIDIPINIQFRIFIIQDELNYIQNVSIQLKLLEDDDLFEFSYQQDIKKIIHSQISELYDSNYIYNKYIQYIPNIIPQIKVIDVINQLRIKFESTLLTQTTLSQFEVDILCNQIFQQQQQQQQQQSINKQSKNIIKQDIIFKIDNPLIQIKDCETQYEFPIQINQQHYNNLIKRIIREHQDIFLEYFSYNNQEILNNIFNLQVDIIMKELNQELIRVKNAPQIQSPIIIDQQFDQFLHSIIKVELIKEFTQKLSNQKQINQTDLKLYDFMLRQQNYDLLESPNTNVKMIKTQEEWESIIIYNYLIYDEINGKLDKYNEQLFDAKQLINFVAEQYRFQNLNDFADLLKQILKSQNFSSIIQWSQQLLTIEKPKYIKDFPLITNNTLLHYKLLLNQEGTQEEFKKLDILDLQKNLVPNIDLHIVLKYVQYYIDYICQDPQVHSNPLGCICNDDIHQYLSYLKSKSKKISLKQTVNILLQGFVQISMEELPFYEELLRRYHYARSQQILKQQIINKHISIDFFQKILDLTEDDLMQLSSNEIKLIIMQIYKEQLQKAIEASRSVDWLILGYPKQNDTLLNKLQQCDILINQIQEKIFIRDPNQTNLDATINFIQDLKQSLTIIRNNMNLQYIEAWILQSYQKYYLGFKDFLQPIYEAMMYITWDEEYPEQLTNNGFRYLLTQYNGQQLINFADSKLINQEERDVFKMDDAKMYILLSRKIKALIVDQYTDKAVEDEQKQFEDKLQSELNQYRTELEQVGKVTTQELKSNVQNELTQLDLLSKEYLDYVINQSDNYLIILKTFGKFCYSTLNINDILISDAFLYQPQYYKMTNVYKQNDINEIKQLYKLLMETLIKINNIQQSDLFSENEMINAMGTFVIHLLRLSIYSTPLIKFVTGVELLIEKIEHWDKTVPKEYKIYGFELQNLVIKWRKLERDGWKYLLSNKIQELWCVESIILFKLLRNLNSQTIHIYLNDCDIGVYEIRLLLLQHISQHVNISNRILIQQHLAKCQIYSETYNQQMGSNIQAFIKEVQEYRKLVSWESKNYLIIQQTSHKMHGKLIKVQGRFRSYLNEKFQKIVVQKQLQDEFCDSIEAFQLKQPLFIQESSSKKQLFYDLLSSFITQSLQQINTLKESKSNAKLSALKNFQEYLSTLLGLRMHLPYKEEQYILENEQHQNLQKSSYYFYKSVSILDSAIKQVGKFVPSEYISRSVSMIQDYLKKLIHQFKLISTLLKPICKINNSNTLIPQDYLNCLKGKTIYNLLKQFTINQKETIITYIQDKITQNDPEYHNQFHILLQLKNHIQTISDQSINQDNNQNQELLINNQKIQAIMFKYTKYFDIKENLLLGEVKLINSLIKHGSDEQRLNLIVKNLECSTKFLYFMTSILCNIIVKGFCQRDEDDDEGQEGGEDCKGGTGIGDGVGQQNITKEIEYEEQLLGEQNQPNNDQDQQQEENKEKQKKEDEFDMKNDFQGKNQEREGDEDEKSSQQDQNNDEDLDEGFSSVEEDNEEMKQFQGDEEEQEDDEQKSDQSSNRKKSDIEFNAEQENGEQKLSAKQEKEQKQNNKKRNLKDFEEASHDQDSQLDENDEELNDEEENQELSLQDHVGKGGEQLEEQDEQQEQEIDMENNENQEEEEKISMNDDEQVNEEMPIEEEIKFDEPQFQQEPEQQDINEDIMQKEPQNLDKQDQIEEEGQQDQEMNQLFKNQDNVEDQLNEQAQDQGQQGDQGNGQNDNEKEKQKDKEQNENKQKGSEVGKEKLEMLKKLFESMEQNLTKEDFEQFKKDLNVHDSGEENEINEGDEENVDFKISQNQIKQKQEKTTNLATKFTQKQQTDQIQREGDEEQKNKNQLDGEQNEQSKEDQESKSNDNIEQEQNNNIQTTELPKNQRIEIENNQEIQNNNTIVIEDYIKQYYRLGFDVNNDWNLQRGLELWPQIQKDVLESSIHLCEELKTILIATQMSALKGDYKTGKRLNMKKIIPYIASNYRKDKIWLRRTQPSKRTYQILLALDDSLSMSENQVGYLSLQSLTSLSLALSKMEAGQLGIASIHEGMRLIHDFNKPFTILDCPLILGHFQFQYESKQSSELSLMRFMRESIDKFKSQRTSNTQQICFIMSDGKFNKKMVRPLIREAEELQIFYVFIILDKDGQSIQNIKSTHYVTINGKQQIEIKNYLEDFPFRYYVIIKSPHELNHVLVNILRQYYQLLE